MDNRYYFDKSSMSDNKITITGQEFVHLTKVRRAVAGDEIVAFCGDGKDYRLKIIEISKNSSVCKIVEVKDNPSMNRPQLSVYFSAIKRDAMHETLDNLTQLNIKNINIYESEYSQVKLKDEKIDKINNNLIQFSKQCERADIPIVRFMSFKEMLKELRDFDLVIMAYENADENLLSIDIPKFKRKKIAIIIGGEGGFSSNEVMELKKFAKIISLGKTILRAPVATTVLSATVLALLGEFER